MAASLRPISPLIMLDGLVRNGTCETDDAGDGGASAAIWSASCRVQDLFGELDLVDGADESLDGFPAVDGVLANG
jgi:hypothetical protein